MKTKTFEKLPEQKQLEILDAAAGIFANKGYYQAGINEICQATGISNGALYKYFENKKGLFKTVARRTLDLILNEFRQYEQKDGSIWETLQQVLDMVLPFTTMYRDYFVVFMDLGSPSMDVFSSELSDDFEKQTFEFYARLIKNAKEDGEIRTNISTETAAYFIDNHLTLLAYSCVSQHYNRRFHQYFPSSKFPLGVEGKIDLIMRSFRELLMA